MRIFTAFVKDEYLLVVNASNRQKDWDYFQKIAKDFPQMQMTDRTEELAMMSLQGPQSKNILSQLLDSGQLPEPMRNALSIAAIKGQKSFHRTHRLHRRTHLLRTFYQSRRCTRRLGHAD